MTNESSGAYDAYYFATGCGRPYRRDPEWLELFGAIARRIQRDIGPASVLDAGCAFGFLVEHLRALGVDAFGLDLSEYAISQVQPDTRPFCWTASIASPLERHYDLIVCIEVLEHTDPQTTELALDNITSHTGDVLFSSTPFDYAEASHVNVRPPAYWAEAFARRGFYRDLAFDAGFVTKWAARYRRTGEPPARIIAAYESRMWELQQELDARRELNMRQRAELAEAAAAPDASGMRDRAGEIDALRAELDTALRAAAALDASAGGRLLRSLQRLRANVAPPGSRRDHLLSAMIDSPPGSA